MKSKKQWLLAMVMVFSMLMLVACGDKKDENKAPTEEITTTETETSTEEDTGNQESSEVPETTEAPLVKRVGDVDDATYDKAVAAYGWLVSKMRGDGMVKESDVCVTLDGTDIKVDITFDNTDLDLTLIKDEGADTYTLTFDYNFTWLEGFGPTINGQDPAKYNEELLIATLGMISGHAQALFDRIDLDCFSAAGLSQTEWELVGDYYIKSGEMVVDEFISYNLKKFE